MISVVMSVYNEKSEFLKIAIESILCQTYRNFEFIIVDDCSTNDIYSVIKEYNDIRIKYIRNKENLGLTKSLNIAIRNARGEFIARMDSDDKAMPQRLYKQVSYMKTHRNVVALGTWARIMGSDEIIGNLRRIGRKKLQAKLLLNNIRIVHPSVMIRKSVLDKNDLLYDERLINSQDYGLWVQCIKYGDIYSYPEVLMEYRVHESQISTKYKDKQLGYNFCVCKWQMEESLKMRFSDKELTILEKVRRYDDVSLLEVCGLFGRIIDANDSCKVFDKRWLIGCLLDVWLIYIKKEAKKRHYDFLRMSFTANIFRPDIMYYVLRYHRKVY